MAWPILHLPPQALVMQGARPYTNAHPFVMALRRGVGALREFYAGFRPGNLAEMYGLGLDAEAAMGLPPWALPWRDRDAPPGEHGLDDSHGVSFYGPCSDQKIALEYRRLESLAERVAADGYRPDLHGHISGQLLARGREWRFFVAGGKHRAAVLAGRGETLIPVALRPKWALVIRREQVGEWPLVRRGLINRCVAERIFDCYFEA